MHIMKTGKDVLLADDVLKYIHDYEMRCVPEMDSLWEYYLGKNIKIKGRKSTGDSNPDNKISVSYGKKIVTTFTGYGYRPKYISISSAPNKDKTKTTEEKKAAIEGTSPYYDQLLKNYKLNNEHIKTSRAGRNFAIFGVAYELIYIESNLQIEEGLIVSKNVPRFFSVDPREMIILYDYSPEPKKKIAIRFYKIDDTEGKVEVYYKDHTEIYTRKFKDENGAYKDSLKLENSYINFTQDIPVASYYFGDEMNGVISSIVDLVDAYDTLISDSMNEFDRFAFAYMVMKKFGLTDQMKNKSQDVTDKAIKAIKRKRLFEFLPEGADISFLTKDIPTEFIQFMTTILRDQIHIQSHVPDFTSDKMAGASGVAIQRLLFDFENLMASTEADFDVGLYERMTLISNLYTVSGGIEGIPEEEIVITHKRNTPLNLKEFADTALIMKHAGFSRYLIANIMPDDIIPDVQEELDRQDEDAKNALPDIENMFGGNAQKQPVQGVAPQDEPPIVDETMLDEMDDVVE